MNTRSWAKSILFLVLFLYRAPLPSLAAEIIVEEGEHRGLLLQEEDHILKTGPVMPGQTFQAYVSPQWSSDGGGTVEWVLADQTGATLKTAHHYQPDTDTILLEWTSNSEPKPRAYFLHIRGKGGSPAGGILGEYVVHTALWDQNDGNAGTDAPESFEKALELPVSEPGRYDFEEGFLSGSADIYDIYKLSIKPNHSLTLRAQPLQWNGTGKKARVRWEFLNRSFMKMREGGDKFSETTPFTVKVFHPQVRSSTKPTGFYLLIKIEGDASLIYSIQAEVKEGR